MSECRTLGILVKLICYEYDNRSWFFPFLIPFFPVNPISLMCLLALTWHRHHIISSHAHSLGLYLLPSQQQLVHVNSVSGKEAIALFVRILLLVPSGGSEEWVNQIGMFQCERARTFYPPFFPSLVLLLSPRGRGLQSKHIPRAYFFWPLECLGEALIRLKTGQRKGLFCWTEQFFVLVFLLFFSQPTL